MNKFEIESAVLKLIELTGNKFLYGIGRPRNGRIDNLKVADHYGFVKDFYSVPYVFVTIIASADRLQFIDNELIAGLTHVIDSGFLTVLFADVDESIVLKNGRRTLNIRDRTIIDYDRNTLTVVSKSSVGSLHINEPDGNTHLIHLHDASNYFLKRERYIL